jgi:3-methylcrotonyl-CoA carboxylase beta subunit
VIPTDTRKPFDVREIIARIVDGSEFDEFKARYGTTLVCGFAHRGHAGGHRRQQRHPVQRERAEGRALHRAVLPAQDPAGVPAEHHRLHGRPQVRERRHRPPRRQDGDGRGHANVPKFTVIIGGSFGAGNYGMCGRAYSRASCGCGPTRASRDGRRAGRQRAGHRQARRHRGQGRQWSAEEEEAFKAPIREQYETRATPTTPPRACGTTASSTRPTRAACWRWACRPRNAPIEDKFGVFRM